MQKYSERMGGTAGSAAAERCLKRPGLAEGAPQDRRLLDEALGPLEGRHQRHDQAAASGRRRQIIVELQFDVGPVALVGLVADGEIEALKAALDRVAQELVQMRAARA